MFKTTKTIRMFGKTVAVVASNVPRLYKSRYEITKGSTFYGIHLGKKSYFISIPSLSSRKFGGINDIVKT